MKLVISDSLEVVGAAPASVSTPINSSSRLNTRGGTIVFNACQDGVEGTIGQRPGCQQSYLTSLRLPDSKGCRAIWKYGSFREYVTAASQIRLAYIIAFGNDGVTITST
jgi:hypothetical protein